MSWHCGTRSRSAAAFVVAGLVLLSAQPAAAATVTGRLVMGTEGAELPQDLPVMVLELREATEPGEPRPATVAEDGSFRFEAEPGLDYIVGTFYESIAYNLVVPADTSGTVELTVYEPTNDVSTIRVVSDSLTIVRGEESDVLEVLQLLRVENSSDRTFAGPAGDESGRVLAVPVPESAFDLAPAGQSNPAGLATDGGEVVMTTPLLPGQTSIPYLYRVRVPRSGWQLRREVLQPTDHADLLIGRGLAFEAGPGFEFAEETELSGQAYRRYRRQDLTPGSVLAADIAFASDSGSGVWVGAAIALGALVALLGGAEVVRRKRKKGAARPEGTPTEEPVEPTRGELIDQIARLDEEHASGAITEQDHRQRRERLIAEVERVSAGRSDPDPGSA